jgi:hypothetical protein
MPLERMGRKMRLLPLPSDSPLEITLQASDLFSDAQIEKHQIEHASWTMEFTDFPEELLTNIQSMNATQQRKRKEEEIDDGDKSGDYGVLKKSSGSGKRMRSK